MFLANSMAKKTAITASKPCIETVFAEIPPQSKRFSWNIKILPSFAKDDDLCVSEYFYFDQCKWSAKFTPSQSHLSICAIDCPVVDGGAERPNYFFRLGLLSSNRAVKEFRPPTAFDGEYFEWKSVLDRDELSGQNCFVPGGVLCLVILAYREKLWFDRMRACVEGLDLLREHLNNLYISNRNADVTISVRGSQFRAHKAILAARSPVIGSMFSHNTIENESGTINIVDCDPVSFGAFLQFLYTGDSFHVAGCNVVELYKTADKYQVLDLKRACLRSLMDDLSLDSVTDAISVATVYGENDLLNSATKFFVENARDILRLDKWKQFLLENSPVANELLIKLVDHLQKS